MIGLREDVVTVKRKTAFIQVAVSWCGDMVCECQPERRWFECEFADIKSSSTETQGWENLRRAWINQDI